MKFRQLAKESTVSLVNHIGGVEILVNKDGNIRHTNNNDPDILPEYKDGCLIATAA